VSQSLFLQFHEAMLSCHQLIDFWYQFLSTFSVYECFALQFLFGPRILLVMGLILDLCACANLYVDFVEALQDGGRFIMMTSFWSEYVKA